MINKLKFFLSVIFLTFLFHFLVFILLDKNSSNLNYFFSKIVTQKYMTFEPYIVRGRVVEIFFFDCKDDCLPFQKIKKNEKYIFFKKISDYKFIEKKSIIYPLSFDSAFKELSFYTKLPIYFSYVGLGQIYYADWSFIQKAFDRYKNSFLLDQCFGVLKNKNYIPKNKQINPYKEILIEHGFYHKEDFNCENLSLDALLKILKTQNVGYLIEHSTYGQINAIKKELCVGELCLYSF